MRARSYKMTRWGDSDDYGEMLHAVGCEDEGGLAQLLDRAPALAEYADRLASLVRWHLTIHTYSAADIKVNLERRAVEP